MNTKIYEKLKELYDKYRAQEFGKLCQKFLAIAFLEAGYSHIVERGVQGVDIDAADEGGNKYAVEVKTTKTSYINFEQKDVNGLQKRKEDGYQPVLAVLQLDRFSDWIFANADTTKPGNIYIDSLRVQRLRELEKHINSLFDKTLQEHYKGTLQEGQSYLDNVLRQKGIEVKKS